MNKEWNDIQMKYKIQKHSSPVRCLLTLKDGRLVSCSEDSTIQIFDSKEDYRCDVAIEEDDFPVFYISLLENGRLLSCLNKDIKIWKITFNLFQCEAILKAHSDKISKIIQLTRACFASCSYDNTIKIWSSYQPYQCIITINCHNGPVTSILELSNMNTLVSCSEDRTIRWWNTFTYECEFVNKNIYSSPYPDALAEMGERKIVVGGWNTLKIIDAITHQIIMNIRDINLDGVFSFLLEGENLLFGNIFGNIYKMNVITNEYKVIKKNAHDQGIFCIMAIDKEYIASCSFDENIKIWK